HPARRSSPSPLSRPRASPPRIHPSGLCLWNTAALVSVLNGAVTIAHLPRRPHMNRILAGVLLAALSLPGFAQAPNPPARVRGTVEKLENNVLTVKTHDGTANIKLADNYTVIGVSRAKIADIGAGKDIGTTTLGERNGGLVALEIHIFPENMRGVGEGHYPWDLKPESKMTNGNVADVKSVGKDQMLTVTYKGGEQKVLVPNSAKVVVFGPGERSELKKGAHVFCVAQKAADGSLPGAGGNVGVKGTVPPM